MAQPLGRQIYLELYGCTAESMNDADFVLRTMEEAAEFSGATIVESFINQFNPQGLSGVVVIAESHIAIHTWPEYGYAAVDVFTCGDRVMPETAAQYMIEAFKPERTDQQVLDRGLPARIGVETVQAIPEGGAPVSTEPTLNDSRFAQV